MLYGLDVSNHQGTFDLARARSEGFDFALFKASEGAGYRDPMFTRNLTLGRQVDLLCGAYHYQRGDAPAAAQVATITAQVPRDCPVLLDVENNSGDLTMTWELTNRLRDAGYHMPLLYLPEWYWQQLGRPNLVGLPALWSSRYPNSRAGAAAAVYQRNAGWLDTLWGGYGGLGVAVLQFTDQGSVAGQSPVDCNAFRGTRADLQALFGGSDTPGGLESMAMDTTWVDSYGNTQTVQSFMSDIQRKINDLWYPATQPGTVPSRIPGDTNRTNIYDMVKDSTAWTNEILGLVARLSVASGTDPAAVAQALRPALAEIVGPVVKEAVTEALGADHDATAQAIVDSIAARLSRTEQGGTQ